MFVEVSLVEKKQIHKGISNKNCGKGEALPKVAGTETWTPDLASK